MDDREVTEAEALIGDEADAFMRSELGRTLLGIAEQDAAEAMEHLKRISPSETDKIREYQNTIWLAERFKGWLVELFDRGEQAIKILQHEDEVHE